MIVLLGQIIPIGLLLALGPTRIMSTILLLTSAHPLRNALAFLGGVASLYLAVGSITLLFFGRTLSDLSTGTIIIDAILVVAGVFLLVLAARSFFITPDPDAPPPGWMQRVTSLSTGHAFLFGVILACSIALWALLYFPRHLPDGTPDYDALVERAGSDDARESLRAEKRAILLENSYGGRLGHAIEPAIKPLGFDWKIGVGIIGAFAAREVFVSTLGIVYAVGDEADEQSEPLRQALRDARDSHGARVYTPLVGISLMIFFALACQCMSTLAVVRRETATLRWPVFLFAYMGVLAWVTSFCVFQLGQLLGLG